MYTGILHRLQIFRAHSLYKVIDQAKESNINLMYSYVSIRLVHVIFVRLCGSREILFYILYIYTQR